MKILLLLLLSSTIFISCDNHSPNDQASHTEEHSSHEEDLEISEQALKNMGVVIDEIDSSDFIVTMPVPAYIHNHPLNTLPIYAPLAGRVQTFSLEPGQLLKSDQSIIKIIRDPIKRPELKLVQNILQPANEEYHTSISQLRSALKSLDILETELQRLQKFKKDNEGLSIVPQKDIIDLRYQITNAKQDVDNVRTKLQLHGLSDDSITNIAKGKQLVQSPNLWLNALKQNSIWNDKAEQLFSLTSEAQRSNRWVIASIGELAAEELINDSLITFFTDYPKSIELLLEIASLLQDGHSLTDIENLFLVGALNKIIEIKAPVNNDGWDLQTIHIKPGQIVARGDKLLSLINPEKMIVKAEPSGSELKYINQALKKKLSVSASPLIKESSKELKNLQISKLDGTENGVTQVYVPALNSLLSSNSVDNNTYRNWALREGMKFTLNIPEKVLEDVIVLPSEAILDQGPDKIVFSREGDEFIPRKVVVLYQNDEVAVIGEGSELLPEEPVVVKGAFALQLALIAGTPAAVDPHAGCSH